MSKILKPVLNECVTPVTCYWSLSLIVRGEEELTLVFKVIHLIFLFDLNIFLNTGVYLSIYFNKLNIKACQGALLCVIT